MECKISNGRQDTGILFKGFACIVTYSYYNAKHVKVHFMDRKGVITSTTTYNLPFFGHVTYEIFHYGKTVMRHRYGQIWGKLCI